MQKGNKLSKVTLVAITKPLVDGIYTAEEFVAFAARVSNPSNQINNETAPKLLKYLMAHKHWSPLEMVSLTMEIETTRDIGRQIIRHRSFSFQEFSQRYADVREMGFEIREARLQDQKNRQNSIETDNNELKTLWEEKQKLSLEKSKDVYDWAIKNGIAKEQARAVLPEGMTKSRMYMAGTLRSFLHFISVRQHPAAQKEIREIAASIYNIIVSEFPAMKGVMEQMIEENYHG